MDLLEAMMGRAGRTGLSKPRVDHSSSLPRPPLEGWELLDRKTTGESWFRGWGLEC